MKAANLNLNKLMDDSRFAISSKDGIQNLKEKASNDNTKKAHRPGSTYGVVGRKSVV